MFAAPRCRAATAAAVILVCASAAAQAAQEVGRTSGNQDSSIQSIEFAPTTLAGSQSARVTLVNLINPPDPDRGATPPDPCHVQVTFLDAQGGAIGDTQSFDVAAGQSVVASAPAVLQDAAASDAAAVRAVRARVLFPTGPCRGLNAANEVFDSRSGGTLFINPGAVRGYTGNGTSLDGRRTASTALAGAVMAVTLADGTQVRLAR